MGKVIHFVERSTWSEVRPPSRVLDREGNIKPGTKVIDRRDGDRGTVISTTDKTVDVRISIGKVITLFAGDDFSLGPWDFV